MRFAMDSPSARQLAIAYENTALQLTVRDNGKGFDPSNGSSGFGIRGMENRAHSISADLEISSAPDQRHSSAKTGCRYHLRSSMLPGRVLPGNGSGDEDVMESQTVSSAIRLLIVDDHPVVRAGLMSMLRRQSVLKVVGGKRRCSPCVCRAQRGRCGPARSPHAEIAAASRPCRLFGRSPPHHGSSSCPVLISRRRFLVRSRPARKVIYPRIRRGKSWWPPSWQRTTARHICRNTSRGKLAERMLRSSRSPRELEILQALSKGLTNKELQLIHPARRSASRATRQRRRRPSNVRRRNRCPDRVFPRPAQRRQHQHPPAYPGRRAESAAHSLTGEPLEKVFALLPCGPAGRCLGYPESWPRWQGAVAQRPGGNQHHTGTAPVATTAWLLSNAGTYLRRHGRFGEGLPLHQQRPAPARNSPRPPPSHLATDLNTLAEALTARAVHRSPASAPASPAHPGGGSAARPPRGSRRPQLRRPGISISTARGGSALAPARPAHPGDSPRPRPPDVAFDLNHVGRALTILGRANEALPLHQRALLIHQAALRTGHPDLANDHRYLGRTFTALGRPDEGLPLHQRALHIDEAAFGPNHPYVAKIDLSTGSSGTGGHGQDRRPSPCTGEPYASARKPSARTTRTLVEAAGTPNETWTTDWQPTATDR